MTYTILFLVQTLRQAFQKNLLLYSLELLNLFIYILTIIKFNFLFKPVYIIPDTMCNYYVLHKKYLYLDNNV